MMRTFITSLSLLALCASALAQTVLYDAAGGQKVSQFGGWFVNPLSLESYSSGSTLYNTLSNNSVQGGFSRFGPTLSRSAGFSLDFTIKVDSETHDGANGPNRSGVSVIVITSDLQGIELAFWPDRVWAQSGPAFTKAEEGFFNTTAALTTYRLRIVGSGYQLLANGEVVLAGELRNYSSFGTPYNIANFMFFGDDTTSARGNFRTTRITLGPAESNPADLNGDCVVDSGDLGLLLLDFGPGGGPSDLDGSGEVDGGDVGMLLLDYDWTC
ncbi:MAG: hypothetical protein K8R92_08525 [Planctomycetes bacterium]|nr:hypothetical protein [Planctomycetota bacterium]